MLPDGRNTCCQQAGETKKALWPGVCPSAAELGAAPRLTVISRRSQPSCSPEEQNLFVFQQPLKPLIRLPSNACAQSVFFWTLKLDRFPLVFFWGGGWKAHSHAGVTSGTRLSLCFQSSAAAPGSSPAAVGRCSVSPCPGSATAGRRARTRATRWTAPVSTAPLGLLTPPTPVA